MPHSTILVNSYKSNTLAVDALLRSFREARMFKEFAIIVVIGGHDEYSHETRDGILYVYANHNSIDNTALIAVLEYPLLSTYSPFLYIHDTCVVGPAFFEKVSALPSASSIRMIANVPSMNIGLYTQEIIEANRRFLMEMKGTDPTRLLSLKQRAIDTEDHIFKHDALGIRLDCNRVTHPTSDPYKTGTPRIIEYYSSLDLYKLKANWGGPIVMDL